MVGIISRLFTLVIGKPNKPSIPFQELIPSDTYSKVLLMVVIYIACNWLASFLRLALRAFQEKLRASIFIDLSSTKQDPGR